MVKNVLSLEIKYLEYNVIKPSCQILWPAMSRTPTKHSRWTRALFVVVAAAATDLSARDRLGAASRVGRLHCAVPKPARRVVAIVRRGGGRLLSVAGGWRHFGCTASLLHRRCNLQQTIATPTSAMIMTRRRKKMTSVPKFHDKK